MKPSKTTFIGIGLLCLIALALYAANPSFQSFNPSQFDITGNQITIKNGAALTNAPPGVLTNFQPSVTLQAPTNTSPLYIPATVGGSTFDFSVSGASLALHGIDGLLGNLSASNIVVSGSLKSLLANGTLPGVSVKGAAAQATNLIEILSSASAPLFNVASNGSVNIGTFSGVDMLNLVCGSAATACVSTENTDNTGYSGVRFLDNTATLDGYVGYANPGAAIVPGTVFLASLTADLTLVNAWEQVRINNGAISLTVSNVSGALVERAYLTTNGFTATHFLNYPSTNHLADGDNGGHLYGPFGETQLLADTNGLVLSTNGPVFPTAAPIGGAAYVINSNGTPYVLLSTPGSTSWTSTNLLSGASSSVAIFSPYVITPLNGSNFLIDPANGNYQAINCSTNSYIAAAGGLTNSLTSVRIDLWAGTNAAGGNTVTFASTNIFGAAGVVSGFTIYSNAVMAFLYDKPYHQTNNLWKITQLQ